MFWGTDLATTSPINSLLANEDVTLQTILEQEDILHECKLGNEKLIQYLCDPEILKALVTLVTTDPPDDLDEKLQYRYANMACEVLSCEKSPISETFASEPNLVSVLYDKLQSKEPLNPLLASFICKVIFSLPQNLSKIINENHLRGDDFVSSLVNHITTSAVMDLLFKSLSRSDSPDISSAYLHFYYKQGLIGKLIALFREDVDPDAQANAAQLLCDIIRFSREQQTCNQEKAEPNPLLDEIESTAIVSQLLINMFETRTESCLVNGIQILQALLEYRRYRANLPPKQPPIDADADSKAGDSKIQVGDFDGMEKCVTYQIFSVTETVLPDLMTRLDIERLTKSVRQVHAAIVPRLEDFHSLLINPPEKKPVRTTIGLIEKPFGATRVEVVHLVRALLSSNNPTINRKLTTLKTLPVLMELFFEYPFNNFLHTQVEQSINCVLDNAKSTSPVTSPTETKETTGSQDVASGDDKATVVEPENVTSLVHQLLVEYNLIQKILDAHKQFNEKQSGIKPSYMGHIIKIANHILSSKEIKVVKTCFDQLSPEVKENWNKFVEETLNVINMKMSLPLVKEAPDHEQNYFSDENFASSNSQLDMKSDLSDHVMLRNFYGNFKFDPSEDSTNIHDETLKLEDEESLS